MIPGQNEDGTFAVGTEVAGYRIVKELGRGGFGVVYLAQNRLGQKVALKQFKMIRDPQQFPLTPAGNEAFASLTKWQHERFEETARDLVKLDHPNIVKVINYVDVPEAKTAFLVMEFVEGRTFGDMLRGHTAPMPLSVARSVLEPIMDALAYMHSSGRIHRDLKPDNIMVRADGSPVLIDFGALKAIEAETGERSSALGYTRSVGPRTTFSRHSGIWSPTYGAPEQLDPDEKLTAATDVYALGGMLHHAVTGVPPISADTRVNRMVTRSADPQPPTPIRREVDVDAKCAKAIDAALALRADDRPGNVTVLKAALGWSGLSDSPEEQSPSLPVGQRSELTKPPALAAIPKLKRSRWPVVVALAFVGVGGLGLERVTSYDRARVANVEANRERTERERIERERIEREQADRTRLANEQAERERMAREMADRSRIAVEASQRERAAIEAAIRDRVASDAADRERIAREVAERERIAREAAERELFAREVAERERTAREASDRERIAREAAERERITREAADRERVAREVAERDRTASEIAERERAARDLAEHSRLSREADQRDRTAYELAERERGTQAPAGRQQIDIDKNQRERAAREADEGEFILLARELPELTARGPTYSDEATPRNSSIRRGQVVPPAATPSESRQPRTGAARPSRVEPNELRRTESRLSDGGRRRVTPSQPQNTPRRTTGVSISPSNQPSRTCFVFNGQQRCD